MPEHNPERAGLRAIATYAQESVAPLAERIDREGFYPVEILPRLGELGAFGYAAGHNGGVSIDLPRQLEAIAAVGSYCGSTAFLAWCQSACAWYLAHAPQDAVKQRYLARVARGELLAGTGMSNAIKHLDSIEKIRLTARRTETGYVLNGILPWVSNMGPGHLLLTVAALEDGGYVMLALESNSDGLTLHDCPGFSGMEGTATFNLRFHNVHADRGAVLAEPAQFDTFLQRIKPGFLISQTGIGLGLVQACVNGIEQSNAVKTSTNRFLDESGPQLQLELERAEGQAAKLARQAAKGNAPLLPTLKLRANVSELALRAAQATVLHAGARGYLVRHPAQRHLREAVFVAIVTPALKHLRKVIHDLEQVPRQVAAL